MTTRPLVLVGPDLQERSSRRGPVPLVCAERSYIDAIVQAGGAPLVAPVGLDEREAEAMCACVHALVLTGGAHDIDPALYGEAPLAACAPDKPERTRMERALVLAALQRRLPVLGICGGMQLMNVARGGTLVQDLAAQVPTASSHQQPGPKSEPHHAVFIDEGSRLGAVVKAARIEANSTHHQAVKALGAGLTASARAPDGVIEAIEDVSLPFFIGVQWHPECMSADPHRAIFRAVVKAADEYRMTIEGNR